MLTRPYLLAIILLLQGCNMQRWCAKHYSPLPDSVSYVSSTTYSDTIVQVSLPATKVTDSVLLNEGATLTLETPFARSTATVRAGKLVGTLEHLPTPALVPVKNAIRKTTSEHYRRDMVPVITNQLTRWQQIQISAAWVFLIIIVVGTAWLWLQRRISWFSYLRRKRQPP